MPIQFIARHALCLFVVALLLAGNAARAVADEEPVALSPLDSYNFVVGTQTIGASYGFTAETRLVETARAILALGSNTLKFKLAAEPSDKTKPQNLVEIARDDASVKTVLEMPFAHYLLWAYPLSSEAKRFQKASLPDEYREIYDLCKYLLATYHGSGKTFYLGNWEGDWHLTHLNPNYVPTDEEVENMTAWVNVRQKAIDDAKRDTPHQNVEVYGYLEVNRVVDAMQGKIRLTNKVLPQTNVDFVSYSAYDALGGEINVELKKALDYIAAQLPPKAGIAGQRVFIGEYGFPAEHFSPAQQDEKSRAVLRAALEWGCPFALYWELYNNEVKDGKQVGFWMIDDQNQKQPVYFAHANFYAQARLWLADFQRKHDRLPSRDEFGQAAVNWLDNAPKTP